VTATTTPQTLQKQLDTALTMLKEEITAESLLAKLHHRVENHNRRAMPLRMNLLQTARVPTSSSAAAITPIDDAVVGPLAVPRVTYTTTIRGATPEERSSVSVSNPRGLHVRDSIHDSTLTLHPYCHPPILKSASWPC
jgi:hypothetical protein